MPPPDAVLQTIRALAAARGLDLSDDLLREIHEELCRRIAAASPLALMREFSTSVSLARHPDVLELIDVELDTILALVAEPLPVGR